MTNPFPKITQLFGLAEDHAQLALLEYSHEKNNFKHALGYLVVTVFSLVGVVAFLHLAVFAGIMALGLAAWAASLVLASVEAIVGFAAWVFFKRTAWRPDSFQGSRQEFQRTFQWIHRHLN
jgi:hypothetical protein